MTLLEIVVIVSQPCIPQGLQEDILFEEALAQYDAYISEAAYLIPQIDVDTLMSVTLIRYAPRTSEIVRTACNDSTQNEIDFKSIIHFLF